MCDGSVAQQLASLGHGDRDTECRKGLARGQVWAQQWQHNSNRQANQWCAAPLRLPSLLGRLLLNCTPNLLHRQFRLASPLLLATALLLPPLLLVLLHTCNQAQKTRPARVLHIM